MRKPGRLCVIATAMPFLTGCFSLVPRPVPPSVTEREALDVRGLVVREGGTEERVEFAEISDLQWRPDAIYFVGRRKHGGGQVVTLSWPLSSLSSVLVRQVDPGKSSAIIGGIVVGAVGVMTLLLTGKADKY